MPYINNAVQKPEVTVNGVPNRVSLPKGCIGICYVFVTKEASEEFLGEEFNQFLAKIDIIKEVPLKGDTSAAKVEGDDSI